MSFDFVRLGGVSCFRFQNECNKVEIALRVVQFWSEIKLVITNRDFVITRLISDQIALHSVQLPLFIMYVQFTETENIIKSDIIHINNVTIIYIYLWLCHMTAKK